MNRIVAFTLLSFVLNVPSLVFSESQIMTRSLQGFLGEDHRYSIDFMVFKRLGEGRLRFESTGQPAVFRAELSGRTVGLAAWLSNQRTQTYTATMRQMPDGSFKSIEYVSVVRKKRDGQWEDSRRVFSFDQMTGKVFEKRLRGDIVVSEKEHGIPEGQAATDILTAFYNVRSGIYGELQKGKSFSIPTVSSKGFSEIMLKILTAEEQQAERGFPQSGFLVQVKMPPAIFGTSNGLVYVWFDNIGTPAQGVLENMIGFGDVKGYLMEGRQ